MTLGEELQRIALRAVSFAAPGEEVAGVLASEPRAGTRAYLCAFGGNAGRSWLVLDEAGEPVENRVDVREAVSIAAMCEVAAEVAAGGDVEELRAQLVALRLRENPPGIEEAEDAALAVERSLGVPPRLASPRYLDDVGAAMRRLERALGDDASPFATMLKHAVAAVESLTAEVEENYKRPLR